ncbi:MAG: hypothetical protein FRX49_13849 [Trebouxia sp. A1-2]|nr:MAG: hypothetical protein FRX49_13849 [Trebouxia sp. A1-2]
MSERISSPSTGKKKGTCDGYTLRKSRMTMHSFSKLVIVDTRSLSACTSADSIFRATSGSCTAAAGSKLEASGVPTKPGPVQLRCSFTAASFALPPLQEEEWMAADTGARSQDLLQIAEVETVTPVLPGSKHPQEGHHVGCLCIGEEDAGQESKGNQAIAPYKEENDLETIVGEAEELEVDGRANKKENGDVAAVNKEEPDKGDQQQGQQQLRQPAVEDGSQQTAEVQAQAYNMERRRTVLLTNAGSMK